MKGEKSLRLSHRWSHQSSLTCTWTQDKHKNTRTSNTDKLYVCSLNAFSISALSLRWHQLSHPVSVVLKHMNSHCNCNVVFMARLNHFFMQKVLLFSSFRFFAVEYEPRVLSWDRSLNVCSVLDWCYVTGCSQRRHFMPENANRNRKTAGASRQRTT